MDELIGYLTESAPAPYLRPVLVFLLAAVLVAPLFQRLKASPVLGYLVIGAALGPFGLKVVDDIEGINRLAQFGVVFLLFTIGLELSFERLRRMWQEIFGLGLAQVALSAIIIGGIAHAWGNSMQASLVLGICMALSSTAIITPLLIERGEFASNLGRIAFAILLFQDLAVAPLLVMVNVFAGADAVQPASLGVSLARSLAVLVLIVAVGRLSLRPLFRIVASARIPEVLLALSLLVVLVISAGAEAAGLSAALGAFLAGMLLAETEFRHQVELDIQPFKGLLLGLFFISVGMGFDYRAMLLQTGWVLASVAGLIAIKAAIMVVVARLNNQPLEVTIPLSLLLSPAGEFALVIIGAATAGGVLDVATGQFMLMVSALSMAMTPFMLPLGLLLVKRLRARSETAANLIQAGALDDISGHVIIAGFGRVGQTVARLLSAQKIPYVALDSDARTAQRHRQAGLPVFFGGAARADVLARLGMDKASAMVLTIDSPQTAKAALAAIRARWPNIPVFVRARDSSHSRQLEILGATGVVPETLEASLALAGQVLKGIGTPVEAVNLLIERIRQEQYAGIGEIGAVD